MYRHMKATRVFDPYAGWGNRCTAAMALGIDYVGVDRNPRLVPCYDKLLSFYPHTSKIRFISGKSEEADLGDYVPDLIFSSPPFWLNGELIERYPECEVDRNKFLQESLLPTLHKWRPFAHIVLHVNSDLLAGIKQAIGQPTKTFKFKKMVQRSDHCSDSLFFWESRPPIVRGPYKSQCCKLCGTTELNEFEPGKKTMCRKCKNDKKRKAAISTTNTKRQALDEHTITSVAQARRLVSEHRIRHNCKSFESDGEPVLDLRGVTKKLVSLRVTLPGVRGATGTELRLAFATAKVLADTVQLFQAISKEFNRLDMASK